MMHSVALSRGLRRFVPLLALLLAACSEDGSASTSTGSGGTTDLPNACTLVTAEQIADLLGAEAEGMRTTASIGVAALDRCDWEVQYETPLEEYSLVLSISSAAAYAGEDGLIPSEPYALGDEARLQVLSRSAQVIWKSGAYSASLKMAIFGEPNAPFDSYVEKTLAIAASVDAQL